MTRPPQVSTRTDTICPYSTLFRSQQVQDKHELALRSKDLAELVHTIKSVQRCTVAAIFGSGLLIVAAILYGLEAGGPRLLSIPAAAWIAGDRKSTRLNSSH